MLWANCIATKQLWQGLLGVVQIKQQLLANIGCVSTSSGPLAHDLGVLLCPRHFNTVVWRSWYEANGACYFLRSRLFSIHYVLSLVPSSPPAVHSLDQESVCAFWYCRKDSLPLCNPPAFSGTRNDGSHNLKTCSMSVAACDLIYFLLTVKRKWTEIHILFVSIWCFEFVRS